VDVLIATDGSDPALNACRLMTRMLTPGRDRVRLLTVLSYHLYPTALVPGERMPDEGEAAAAVRDEIERATGPGRRALADARLDPEVIHRFGNPTDEIVTAAEDWGPDLVVLGRRGVRGVERVLGSVSDHVIHRVRNAAVLLVP
jgi:nucleotide-binding universal stress UspA family protein